MNPQVLIALLQALGPALLQALPEIIKAFASLPKPAGPPQPISLVPSPPAPVPAPAQPTPAIVTVTPIDAHPILSEDAPSANFTGYTANLSNVWAAWFTGKNPEKPESDEATAEAVQAIRAGTAGLPPGAIFRFSADPQPNPSQGPNRPTWHFETPAGPCDWTISAEGDAVGKGPGTALIKMIVRMFERSRGCYVSFHRIGHLSEPGAFVGTLLLVI